MGIVNRRSLAETLDMLNAAFFYRRHLSKAVGLQAAKWVASRQGKPGSYADMFAPTELDYERGINLFTGERVNTHAGTGHVLGEEACRALILLDVQNAEVKEALSRATKGMLNALRESHASPGWFCCGRCTCSYWRHLAVGGLENREAELTGGIKTLRRHRDGHGRWSRFPFYYTVLALNEIELPSALDEIRYAAPALERAVSRAPKNTFDQRRVDLAERALNKI